MWVDNDVIRGLIFAAIGFILLIVESVVCLLRRKRRLLAVSVTRAKVTNVCRRVKSPKGKPSCRITYEYYAEGAYHKVASPHASRYPVLKDGEEVDLYFIPGQPDKLYVPKAHYKEKGYRLFEAFVIFYGTAAFLVGLGVAFL